MTLNIINNFKTIYYNTLTNFYIYFNTFVPYYDDVILSLSITSFKNIINNNQISLRSIKENRLIKLVYSLNDKDKIVVDDDGFVFIDYHPKDTDVDYDDDANDVNDAKSVVEHEPVTEPVAEAVVEPVTEPVTEPVAEPVTEPVAEAECYNSLEKKNN
jgi:hypothetical protein